MVWNDSYFIAIATNATAHKVNSYYTLAISYYTFCVRKHYFRPWFYFVVLNGSCSSGTLGMPLSS